MSNVSIAIVGAGISGLTAAHTVEKAGFRPVVFEASDHAGGRMYSEQHDDHLFDLGTIMLLGGSPMLTELVNTAGLSEYFDLADALVVAIVKDSKIKRIDSAHPIKDFLNTDLFSFRTKLKLVKLIWKVLKHQKLFDSKNAIGYSDFDEETIAQYAERALGKEASEYLCSPLMRGVWCTDAKSDSSVRLFWTLRQMIYPLHTLSCGNGALTRELAKQHDVRYSQQVTGVAKNNSGIELQVNNGINNITENFSGCIVAVPPPIALQIVPEISGVQRKFFETAQFTSLLCIHFGLSEKPCNTEMVLMFPEIESNDIAGVYPNIS